MNENKVVITQSNYIPWKGYFDLINFADKVILYDEMQYTKRDWRNRNYIKTKDGLQWLTIPVKIKGNYHQKINQIKILDHSWRSKHWLSILHNYKNCPYFKSYACDFEYLFRHTSCEFLSDINRQFIDLICDILNIKTSIEWSRDFKLRGNRTEKLLNLCNDLGATHYVTGNSAKSYLDEELFEMAGVKVIWMDYSNYPQYPQHHDGFSHQTSVIDLLFNTGPNAIKYMKKLSLIELTSNSK